jgi:DNA-binding NtrC family response regulator
VGAVLVVGGDSPVSPFIHVVARSRGHRVVDVSGSEGALAELDRQAYDLLIVDLTGETLDEEALLRRLRSVRHRANTPTVVLSGPSLSKTALAEAELAVVDHLTEPIDMVAIGQAVDRAFSTDPRDLELRRRSLARSAEMHKLIVDLQEEAAQKD